MRTLRLTASFATTVAAAALLVAPPAGASVARLTAPTAHIVSTPAAVYFSPDLSYIDVGVEYRCKNSCEVRYYLDGRISQRALPETYYGIGSRNVSGTVTAT